MNRAALRTDRQHPRCEGSAFYGEHEAKPLTGYTLIGPDGRARYCCDLDCLRRHVDGLVDRFLAAGVARSVEFLRRGGR